MTTIRILPEIMANKIAAGEVVERPSSVVKELLENAIDANSSRIQIDIEQGGRSLIRVSDNGIGMNGDDALISLERYATSKILDDTDLFSIKTLGFRGEALPSIASVSKFTMITRDQHSEAGVKIVISGGKIQSVTEYGAPRGTMISVCHLFYNTPARRKFLKSNQTEMGHILDTVSSLALGWPDIQFSITHQAKMLKTWTQAKDPCKRVVDILGGESKGHLHQLQFNERDIHVNGWISSPTLHRSTSQKIFLFINGRYIKDRGLQHALFEGYRGRLVKGRFPMAVLFITAPYDKVDVNVHPTKHEVRFSEKNLIYQRLKDQVAHVLLNADRARWVSNRREHVPEKKPEKPVDIPIPKSEGELWTETTPFGQNTEFNASQMITQPTLLKEDRKIAEDTLPFVNDESEEGMPSLNDKDDGTQKKIPVDQEKKREVPSTTQKTLWENSFFKSLRVIGQFKNSYVVCESDEGLLLVDQHAAHERVYYEGLKNNSQDKKLPVQTLLVPDTLELGYRESQILEKLMPYIKKFGVEIEPFGDRTFIIKAVPAILADREFSPVIVEMVEKMLDTGQTSGIEAQLDECLMIIACHSVIRARQSLTDSEIKKLFSELDKCDDPFHCPHGRPTWIRWSIKDVEKLFDRRV